MRTPRILLSTLVLAGCVDAGGRLEYGASESESSESESSGAGSSESGASESGASESESAASESDASESGASESGTSETGDSLEPIDLTPYWARAGELQTYRKSQGELLGRYRFTEDPGDSFLPLYQQLYDQGHPGTLVSWQKEYPVGDSFCTATYGLLWFGEDGSITEVGDWLAFEGCTTYGAFGYRRLGTGENSGLIWSPAGGLGWSITPELEVDVLRQNTPGAEYLDHGYDAYSTVVLLDRLDSWTAPYGDEGTPGQWVAGGGTTYFDVVHLVLYHGTRSPEIQSGVESPTRCGPETLDPAYPRAQLSRSYADYESYAIELRLARDVGIVSEALLFTESDFWGASAVCSGAVMGFDHDAAEQAWTWFLD